MDRMKNAAALVSALLLAACGPAEEAQNRPDAAPAPAVTSDLTPEAERGMEGARNMLLSFARAIEGKDYGQAWTLLSPGDRQRWSKAGFAAMFAGWREVSVAIADGETEGAAGSLYYTAPVTITGRDRDGRPVRFEGQAVLRRVNDVDGATAAQLRWHFDRLTLDWTH